MKKTSKGTGTTTGQLLEALGVACQNPGKWIKITDHTNNTFTGVRRNQRILNEMARKLGLQISTKIGHSNRELRGLKTYSSVGHSAEQGFRILVKSTFGEE